jgi:hypothetical protein
MRDSVVAAAASDSGDCEAASGAGTGAVADGGEKSSDGDAALM